METATADITDQPAPTAAETQWQGVRDYAKTQGVELPFEDDGAALNTLLSAYKQANERNYYADFGRQAAPHAQEFQEYLRTRQQPQAPAAPPPWKGPEFKEEWLQVVEKDENTGRLRSKAGYDPTIAQKVEAYAEWRERWQKEPEAIIGPLIQSEAQKLVDARFAEQNERYRADQLLSRHAAWMFAADAQGRALYNQQTGQRQITPEGVTYARATEQLWASGIRDVGTIDTYAQMVVQNAVMRQRLLLTQPAANGSPNAAPSSSVGGQLTRPSAAAPAVAAPSKGMSLRDMLRVNLDRAGAPEDLNL